MFDWLLKQKRLVIHDIGLPQAHCGTLVGQNHSRLAYSLT